MGAIFDKEKGIFRSRERGLFKFTLEDGYTFLEEPIPDATEYSPSFRKMDLTCFSSDFDL
jgi:hypothetical protein